MGTDWFLCPVDHSLCFPPPLLFPICLISFLLLPALLLFIPLPGVSSPSRSRKDPRIGWVCLWERLFLRESQRKTACFVKVSWVLFLAEQTVCPCPTFCVCLSLTLLSVLSVCHCLSGHVCVSSVLCVPSVVGWAPWALWRIAMGSREKRSCASSCTGTRLRGLLSPARISTSMTWQVVLNSREAGPTR